MNKKLLLLTLASLSLATITAKKDSNLDDQDMEVPHTDNSRRSGKEGKCYPSGKKSKKRRNDFRHTHPILAAPVNVAEDVLEVPGAIFGCNRCHKHRNSND